MAARVRGLLFVLIVALAALVASSGGVAMLGGW